MPFSLVDNSSIRINVKLDEESLAPDRVVETLNHLQDEVNRANQATFDLIVQALGTCAYTDGAGV